VFSYFASSRGSASVCRVDISAPSPPPMLHATRAAFKIVGRIRLLSPRRRQPCSTRSARPIRLFIDQNAREYSLLRWQLPRKRPPAPRKLSGTSRGTSQGSKLRSRNAKQQLSLARPQDNDFERQWRSMTQKLGPHSELWA
jgi:hypothetical protein